MSNERISRLFADPHLVSRENIQKNQSYFRLFSPDEGVYLLLVLILNLLKLN